MARKVQDILEECIEMLAAGAEIEECLARYPEHREELAPLLTVASRAMAAASSIRYRPEAMARGLDRLTAAAADRGVPSGRWRRWVQLRPNVPRPVLAGLLTVVVATGMAFGTGVASSNSVPGEPLYWVKTQKENISLMLPQSDMARAMAHARLAKARTEEMRRLSSRGQFDRADAILIKVRRHLNKSAGFAGVPTVASPREMPVRPRYFIRIRAHGTTVLSSNLKRDMKLMRARFRELMKGLPPEQQQKVIRLRRRSDMGYFTAISALEGSPVSIPRPFWRVEPAIARDQ